MSSSHLFLGLPIALLVPCLEVNSGFHSAVFKTNNFVSKSHVAMSDIVWSCHARVSLFRVHPPKYHFVFISFRVVDDSSRFHCASSINSSPVLWDKFVA